MGGFGAGRRGWLRIAVVVAVLLAGLTGLAVLGAAVEPIEQVLGLVAALLGLVGAWPVIRRWTRAQSGGPVVASRSATQSVVAPMATAPPVLRGRDAEMSMLRKRVSRPHGTFVVLCGLGGVGKSAIALVLCKWAAERKGRQPWWISARTPETFTEGLVAVAELLGASAADAQGIRGGAGRFQDRFWELLGSARPGWLLVVDDADEVGVLGPLNGTGWIRPSRGGLVLITSRVNDRQVWGRDAEIVDVPPLTERDAARMLLDLYRSGDEEQARGLARYLGGLPLALAVAGRNLGLPFSVWKSFGDYEDAVAAAGIGKLAEIELGVGGRHEPRQAVTSTFELSLDILAKSDVPQARPLLRLLSCYAPGLPVPVSVLTAEPAYTLLGLADADRLRSVLRHLAWVSLVAEHPMPAGAGSEPVVMLHPLVAQANRRHLELGEVQSRRTIHQTAVQLMARALEPVRFDDSRTWPIARALTPHIRQMLTTTSAQLDDSHLEQLLSLATRAVAVFAWSGVERDGETLAADALNRTGSLGHDHPVCLRLRTERAWAIGRHGRWEEARELLAAVYEVWLRSPTDSPESALDTGHKLAWAIGQSGDWDTAYERLSRIDLQRRELLGIDHPDTLHTRCCLAWATWRLGRSEEAIAAYRSVIAARRRILGDDHLETIDARHSLGEGFVLEGRYVEAESTLRSVIRDRDRILGAQHPETLDSRPRYWLGRALRGQGRHREADAVLDELLKHQTRTLGADHPATTATRAALNRIHPA